MNTNYFSDKCKCITFVSAPRRHPLLAGSELPANIDMPGKTPRFFEQTVAMSAHMSDQTLAAPETLMLLCCGYTTKHAICVGPFHWQKRRRAKLRLVVPLEEVDLLLLVTSQRGSGNKNQLDPSPLLLKLPAKGRASISRQNPLLPVACGHSLLILNLI